MGATIMISMFMVLCLDGHTSAKLFSGELVTFVLRDTCKLLLLIVAVVCFKRKCGWLFPRRMSPKWSGTQSVDTREIVYSFLLETIQRLDRNLVNRSENFSIRATRIIIDAALYLFEPDDFTSKCVHSTHTHIHRALFVLFWKPDLWCWRHVPSALILHVVRRRSRQTFLWLSCHSNTNNVYVWKLIWT